MSSLLPMLNEVLQEVVLAPPLAHLSDLLETKPEALATGDADIQLAALQAAKFVFDNALQTESKSRAQLIELLASISPTTAPQTRSQTASANGKRKRDGTTPPAFQGPLPHETSLAELSLEGMDEDQVWAQLELRTANVCDILEYALETTGQTPESDDEHMTAAKGSDEDTDKEALDDLDVREEDGEESEGAVDEDSMESDDLGEEITDLRDPSDDEPSSDLDLNEASFPSGGKRTKYVKPRKGGNSVLDDGFFDLAVFNAETEEAESRAVSKGRLVRENDDDDDEGDREEIDYFTALEDSPQNDPSESQDVLYKDFFEPPPKAPSKSKKLASSSKVRFHQQVRVKNIQAKGKGLPLSAMYAKADEEEDDEEYDVNAMDVDEDDEEYEGGEEDEDRDGSETPGEEEGLRNRITIERFRDDLFAGDEEKTNNGLSTHQKRLAVLREEIKSLEAENVAKKHWTLMGEASSRSRPSNALLEEDVEFERVMKSIPVITEETVQGLENLIKARILESRFDDVVRRRAEDDKPFLPSRFFELQDTKSKQSLAEIYEDEYTAAQSGDIRGDRDGKLQKEHDEIEKIWDSICGKLDALCNAHFTPKIPKTTISTVANVLTATLESALPVTMATTTILAPEEIFAPSPSDLRSPSELTPAEKRTLHNKQKKVKRKARDKLDNAIDKYAKAKGVRKQKEAALKSVVKSGKGVTVIGKERIAAHTNNS